MYVVPRSPEDYSWPSHVHDAPESHQPPNPANCSPELGPEVAHSQIRDSSSSIASYIRFRDAMRFDCDPADSDLQQSFLSNFWHLSHISHSQILCQVVAGEQRCQH